MIIIPPSFSFGICHLSVVPVRIEPSDKAEMTTQVLFGEVFSILEISENGNWVKIQFSHDLYQGWIDKKQYKEISNSYFEDHTSMVHPFTHHGLVIVSFSNNSIPVLGGSILPFLNENYEIDMGFAKAEIVSDFVIHDNSTSFDDWIIEYATSYMGAPYLWGGRTYFGMDCSGFTQQVLKQYGKLIPRDAWQQGIACETIGLEDAQPGDLAFFKNPTQEKISHVGIVLEDLKIIHASGEVRIDQLNSSGILNLETNLFTHHLVKVGRV